MRKTVKRVAEMMLWCVLLISVLDVGFRERHVWVGVWLFGAIVDYCMIFRARKRVHVETPSIDPQKLRLVMLVLYPLGSIAWPVVVPIMWFVTFRNILSFQKTTGVDAVYHLDDEPVTEERIEREGL